MKYVQLNAYGNAWAESIIFKKHRMLIATGNESWVFWARANHKQDDHMIKIASYPEVCVDVLKTRIDGRAGFHSKGITRRLLKMLDVIDPDVVHLHVLCGYWVNVEMLFEWLASHHCQVKWTLHDCWAFTGHCYHFTAVNCTQWKTGCANKESCPQLHSYPETLAGNESVQWSYANKKRLFTMLPKERMELITPSKWLAELVTESYLSKYPVKVVNNTINREIFKPTKSDFRDKYGLEDKFIILGVASKWTEKKGLGDFIKLSNDLNDKYCVVLVGLSEKQIKSLPNKIIKIAKTDSLNELVEIYSASNILFNPTIEDNYPTVNLEAEACGTDVITYDTGGCRETIQRETSRVVKDYNEALRTIRNLK